MLGSIKTELQKLTGAVWRAVHVSTSVGHLFVFTTVSTFSRSTMSNSSSALCLSCLLANLMKYDYY